MGAPKQKWTSEEETALKAGIAKYGPGKWSTILKDPEFCDILASRSNVDLKDKWRNINVMLNGFGSRQRGKAALKVVKISKPENNTLPVSGSPNSEILGVQPHATISKDAKLLSVNKKEVPNSGSFDSTSRLDLEELILEAVTKLKESRGLSRTAIAQYIEEHYLDHPILDRSLKHLTEKGRLIKVKHLYKLPPSSTAPAVKVDSPSSLLERVLMDSSKVEKQSTKTMTKEQIDAEIDKMMEMTPEEAAIAAAQAVAEAEAALEEAERATREAEVAEEDAEAARNFVEAAQKAIKCSRTVRVW